MGVGSIMATPTNTNERMVLEFFATLSDGNLTGLRDFLHPQATWTAQARSIPGAGVHEGHRGILDEFLGPVRGLFAPGDPKVLVDTIVSSGSLVMAETRGVGHLKDGRPYNNLYAWAIEIADGKIKALREYLDSHYIMQLFPTPPLP